MRFNAALRDVRDDLVPVRAHGLIELRNMVLERSPVVLEDSTRLDATISIFIDMLEDADSFVYLNAIRGLSSLADVHGQRFIPRLVGMYTEGLGTEGLDTQLRAGEALLQSIQRAGAMLAQYADLFVPRLLQMVALDTVRAHSALSILAAAAQTNALALHRWAGEITAALDALLVAEQKKSEAVLRRAAVMFLVSLLRGYGERLLELADTGVLQTVLRALRRVSESDSDELTRMHALVGVEELDEALKSQLFPANPSKSAWSGNYLP
ncbi:hypothetical protein BX070DRAFT_189149 [Coemansia spiralis]|nr:hypothetical protein BX070DRAFT_189149 [Coemansia spiralis]